MSAVAAMAEARLRRKQLLSAEEAELFELAQAAGSGLDPEVFRVLLDLLRMNVAPLAVFQVLKSMCAGQRLPPGPEGAPPAAPAPLPPDTRGRQRAGPGCGLWDGAGPDPMSPCAEAPEDGRAPPSALRPPRLGARQPVSGGPSTACSLPAAFPRFPPAASPVPPRGRVSGPCCRACRAARAASGVPVRCEPRSRARLGLLAHPLV
uniref:Mitotic-spindle organizing protein 2B n=1 Tax=Amazona collaria TaxID=241587 RepID=A0A8B9G0R2_9PSIT